MKVRLLKDHKLGRRGLVIEVETKLGRKLIRQGIARPDKMLDPDQYHLGANHGDSA